MISDLRKTILMGIFIIGLLILSFYTNKENFSNQNPPFQSNSGGPPMEARQPTASEGGGDPNSEGPPPNGGGDGPPPVFSGSISLVEDDGELPVFSGPPTVLSRDDGPKQATEEEEFCLLSRDDPKLNDKDALAIYESEKCHKIRTGGNVLKQEFDEELAAKKKAEEDARINRIKCQKIMDNIKDTLKQCKDQNCMNKLQKTLQPEIEKVCANTLEKKKLYKKICKYSKKNFDENIICELRY